MDLAKLIILDTKAGTVSIDGVMLGVYIADEPIEATLMPPNRGLQVLRLPILAERVIIHDGTEQDTSPRSHPETP